MGNVTEPLHIGCTHPNPVYCRRCAFAHGEPPFEDTPMKSNCIMYPYLEGCGTDKPNSVYFDGEECQFYQNEDSAYMDMVKNMGGGSIYDKPKRK